MDARPRRNCLWSACTRGWPAACVALLVPHVAHPNLAYAQQTTDAESAEVLFRHAQSLQKRGDEAAACRTFRASLALVPATGTLLHVARCHEREGLSATALREYDEVAQRAADAGQHERAAFARERAALLVETVPRVRVVAPGRAPLPANLVVLVDGIAVGGALEDGAPIDPGEHRIVVVRGGDEVVYDERRTVIVRERVVIEMAPAAGPAPTQLDAAVPKAVGATKPATALSPPARLSAEGEAPSQHSGFAKNETPASSAKAPNRTPAYLVGGVGAAAVATSVALGIVALSAKQQSDRECVDGRCTREGLEAYADARSTARAATIVFGAGLVAVGVGVALFLSAKSPARPASAWNGQPSCVVRF